jgi:hypothetical protein
MKIDSPKNYVSITIIMIIKKCYGLINVSDVITCDVMACRVIVNLGPSISWKRTSTRRPLNLAPYPKLVPVLLYS